MRGLLFVKGDVLISGDAGFHVIPCLDKAGDGANDHAAKVAHDVFGMATGQLFLRREAEIFANHHTVSNADRSRERLVVRIANTANNLATITRKRSVTKGESAEVAQAFFGDNMVFLDDFKASVNESFASILDEQVVRERLEGVSLRRSGDVQEFSSSNVVFSDNDHMFFFRLVRLTRGNIARFILFVKRKVVKFDVFLIFFFFLTATLKTGLAQTKTVISAKCGDVFKNICNGFGLE